MNEKNRVLITGGAGFIGSHVVEEFLKWRDEVWVVDNLSSGSYENIAHLMEKHTLGFISADICDFEYMKMIFVGLKPNTVVHLAAQPSRNESWCDPVHDANINIMGTLNMIRLSNEHGVGNFVFSSTSAAESSFGYYWTDDEAPPDSPYGISKRAAEWYLGKINKGGVVTILRLANVYGPRQVPLGDNQLIPRALSHIYQQTDFCVYGDGEQTRDFIYVKDVAEAICKAAYRRDTGGVFNISTTTQSSVLNVLEIIRKETGYKKDWQIKGRDFSYETRGPNFVDMPENGFRNMYDWNIRTSLNNGLKKTIKAWPKP